MLVRTKLMNVWHFISPEEYVGQTLP